MNNKNIIIICWMLLLNINNYYKAYCQVKKNNKFKVIEYTSFNNDVAWVMNEDKKWFLADTNGNIMFEAKDNVLNFFSDGVAWVLNDKNEEWELIDKTGLVILNKGYLGVNNFVDGYAWVKNTNKRWMYIDKKGKKKIKTEFYTVGDISEKTTWARYDVWHICNNDGAMIKPNAAENIDSTYPFKNGWAWIKTIDGYWNLIDKSGNYLFNDNELVKEKYDLYNTYSFVRLTDKNWYLIDLQKGIYKKQPFVKVIPFSFQYTWVKTPHAAHWQIIDSIGNLTPLFSINILPIYTNLAWVQNTNTYQWDLYAIDNQKKISTDIKQAKPFEKNETCTFIKINDTSSAWGIINHLGERKTDFIFQSTKPFFQGLAWVKYQYTYWGLVDCNGNIVMPYEYQDIIKEDSDNGGYWIRKPFKSWEYMRHNKTKIAFHY